jgi:Tubulin domain/Misato Segment II tubulin-like domain
LTHALQIDSSVLYRERLGTHGESSYTPRLVVFDAKGSLGGASSRTQHTEALSSALAATWDGSHEVHRAAPIPKSQFIKELEAEEELLYLSDQQQQQQQNNDLEEPSLIETAATALDAPGAVNYFTDFLKAPFHPSTIQLVDGLWRQSTEIHGWSRPGGWLGTGADTTREDASEKIRALAEESDSFAGFQCFVDDLSAWGGIATEVLEEVRDDYGSNRTVMLWALRSSSGSGGTSMQIEAANTENRKHRLLAGLSTAFLSQQCDVYVPMAAPAAHAAFPRVRWRHGDPFHESAILASALDCATLPYRLSSSNSSTSSNSEESIGALDLWSLSSMLTGQHNTPLCALSMALPCPTLPSPTTSSDAAQKGDSRARKNHQNDMDREDERKRNICFTAAAAGLSGAGLGGALDQNRFAECLVLRGARTILSSKSESTTKFSANSTSQMHVSDALRALDTSLLRENGVRCVQHRTVIAQPQPVPLPFPDIFSKDLDTFGDASMASQALINEKSDDKARGHHVASCPVLTRISGTASFGPVVAELAGQWTSAAGAAQGRAILDSWGIDREQSEDVRERLLDLSRAYDEEY